MKIRLRKPFVLAIVLICGVAPVQAQEELKGTQLNWDNDAWAPGHTDRWFTNGTRYAWTYKATPQTAVANTVRSASRLLLSNKEEPTLTYAIGQNLYTPRDIRLARPQPEDRPWAAFTYFGMTSQVFEDNTFSATDLKVGLTGPFAMGEAIQATVHTLIGSARPAGWHQQLGQRLGIQLGYARVYRGKTSVVNDLVDFQWGWGSAVGTLRAYGSLNATVLVGNLMGGNRTPILVGNEGDFVAQDTPNRPMLDRPFSYLSIAGTAVAYNYFVDGTPPYGASTIRALPGYTHAQIGVSLPLQTWVNKDWPRVVYAINVRSSEFETTASGPRGGPQRWGTVTLNWDFDR